MADVKNVHYYVGCADVTDDVVCIWAPNQEDAVRQYLDDGGVYGYDKEDYDGMQIMIVPASKVDYWSVEINDVKIAKVTT
jgi:ABC-type proline/glycine betaine transport system substrate-binding protein